MFLKGDYESYMIIDNNPSGFGGFFYLFSVVSSLMYTGEKGGGGEVTGDFEGQVIYNFSFLFFSENNISEM